MKTTTVKTKIESPWLFIPWGFLAVALLYVCYLYDKGDSIDRRWKWSWKKKAEPVQIVEVPEKEISFEHYLQVFVDENLRVLSPGELVSFKFNSNRITIRKLETCCHQPEKAYLWVRKYKIPSTVWEMETTQLGVGDPITLIKRGDPVAFERKGRFPDISIEIGDDFWLFDQNGDELSKW